MVSARFHLSFVRCPYCKGPLEKTDSLVACAACGARHHADCHKELRQCASCGSAEALVSASSLVPGRAQIALERERMESERDRAHRGTRLALYALAIAVPTTVLVTWTASVEWKTAAPYPRFAEERAWIVSQREEIARERSQVDEARKEGEDQIAHERLALSEERERLRNRDGWRAARFIVEARLRPTDPIGYLREAFRLAPPDQGELRDLLAEWIAEEDRLDSFQVKKGFDGPTR